MLRFIGTARGNFTAYKDGAPTGWAIYGSGNLSGWSIYHRGVFVRKVYSLVEAKGIVSDAL